MKVFTALGLTSLISCSSSAETSLTPVGMPKHHTMEGFRNYPPVQPPEQVEGGFWWNRIKASFHSTEVPPDHYLEETQALQQLNSYKDNNSLTWIGQSTFLLKINGKVILTDPFFDEYVDSFHMVKRFQPPGIQQQNLPQIDYIVLSHNHLDHLSESFIETIPNKQKIKILVPLKMGPFFTERGYKQVYELDWHQNLILDGINFVALPAVHYSQRGLFDKNKTLWCSWAILTASNKFYFSGDTAYSPIFFKEIGKKWGPFDLSLLTIGTYGNRKFGYNNHANPEEAIVMAKELKTDIAVGMHWGTVDLSDEPPWEPPVLFRKHADEAGIHQNKIWIMKIGESRKIS